MTSLTEKYISANGVLHITFPVSTLEHVQDEARQEEELAVAFKTYLIFSSTQAGKEHYIDVFINEIIVIIIKTISI